MKFCDKLQKIRKENNITQEQLADKLSVSRQAVSKWESDQAYPDTEKLIQISKLFNISLDELINDNKATKDNNNKKFNFMETFNLVFDFVSKTFSMFTAMKFWEKCKFLIEMCLLIVIMIAIGSLASNIIVGIVRRIFIFLPSKLVASICHITDTLLYVTWLIIGGIIFVRVLKTRYLDYYVIINDDTITERVVEEPIKELKEKKEYKVVIRDPKDSSLNIFKKIAHLFIILLKCLSIFILIPIVISFIGFVIFLVMSLVYTEYGLFFNGISIAITGAILFNYLIIEYLLKLLFNRHFNYKRMFIIFMMSISFIGIGIGLSFTALNNFEISEEKIENTKKETLNIDMQDNLLLDEINENIEIVIDNNIDNIKLEFITNDKIKLNAYTYSTIGRNNQPYYRLAINYYHDGASFEMFRNVIDNLKDKKIIIYDDYLNYKIDKIYISDKNLTKIKDNLAKAYN